MVCQLLLVSIKQLRPVCLTKVSFRIIARLPLVCFIVFVSLSDNVGIKRNKWKTLAADRLARRSAIHQGVQDYEKRRRNHAITKRQEQKARRDARTAGTAPPTPAG